MGRRVVALIVFLMFSSSSSITTRGSEMSETCFGNCMTLLREAFEIGDDEPCSKKTNTLNEEKNFCNISCKNVSSSFRNDTVSSRTQNFVPTTSSPLLSGSGYNFITLKWNTSVDVSGSIAFYILQVQLNTQSLENSLELPPSIPKYVMVKGSSTNLQSFTVENLVNGFDYRFRVAAIGWNGTMNSEYSNWSPWYSTSGDCNRTTGFIETGGFFLKVKNRIDFPCPVSQITLTLSLKAVDKTPVVLDAYLNWKNPPRIHQLKKFLVRVTVKLLKQEDENIDTICAHYHDSDFQEVFMNRTKTSLHLLSDTNHDSVGRQKKSIHFGCSYAVKFEVFGTTEPNSFESTTTFKIPECVKNVTSCPVPKESSSMETPGVITEKIFSYGNGNLSYAANISWNGEKWIKSHKIEFFYVTIEEKPNSNGGFHYSRNVLAKDGVTSYHAVSYNIPEGKRYKVVVYAYHGSNCVHDTVESKEFKIHQPCPQGCTDNATCLPVDVFDGSAKCTCKLGYTGNGTVCTVQKRCPQGCSANATCFPEDVFDGSAKCKCKDGYTGNGILCTVLVPKPCPQGCTANATCFPEDVFDGTARCKCKDGYTGDGISCPFQEQKPCAQGCTSNATCFPENVFDGSARCKCKDGYTGNGILCTEIRLPEAVAKKPDEKETNIVAVVLPLTVILALVAIILALISWRIRRKKQLVLNAIEAHESAISPSTSNTNLYEHCPPRYNAAQTSSKVNEIELDEKEVNVIYVPQEIQNAISDGLTDGYEFNADQIKFEECLGKGAFGYVHRAQALGITAEPEWSLVAVKTLSEPVTDKSVDDFIAEIELMKRVGDHENIIRMLGCCIVTSPICLIMEYAPHGNLLTYLRTIKTKLLGNDSVKTNPLTEKLGLIECSPSEEKPAIEEESIHEMFLSGGSTSSGIEASKCQVQRLVETNTYLEPFALQIAKGMAYVAGRGIVHRDLAARNVLIGNDYKLKISDFGLSKEGIYVKSTSGKIPLRWLSIEAIRERIYSSASDVWSYGIVLWEICTLGDFPYPTLSDRELLKFLVSGERLEKPSNCSDKMYAMMLKCWQGEPEDRPTFAHLRDVLWKMNTGENPYINIEPMQDLENITTTVDGEDSIENSIVV